MKARHGYILFLFLLLIIEPVSAQSKEQGYVIRLDIETDSDWNAISVKTYGTFDFIEDIVVEGAEVSDIKLFEDSSQFIVQIFKKPYDQTPVKLRIRMVYTGETPELEIDINKGFIGQTILSFYGYANDGFNIIKTIQHENVKNSPDTNPYHGFIEAETFTHGFYEIGYDIADIEPSVYAFYYPWYSVPEGPGGAYYHWNPDGEQELFHSPDYPLLDLYDSLDTDVLKAHIDMALKANIDGFICSWSGAGTVEDKAFNKLLDVAENCNFQVAVYYESLRGDNELNLDNLKQITVRYANNRFYSVYNNWSIFIQSLEQTGYIHIDEKIRVGTVVPGYDDTEIRTPGQCLPRNNLTTYRKYWQNIHENDLDWVVITSFNEWHEGTEIEPSKEYEFTYLQETLKQTNKYKEEENYPQPPKIEVTCNYEKESLQVIIQNTGHCPIYKICINETTLGNLGIIKVLEPLESNYYNIEIGKLQNTKNYSFIISYYSLTLGYQKQDFEVTLKPKEIQPKIEIKFTSFNLTQIEHQTIARAYIWINSTPPQLDYCSLDILLDEKLVHGESWSHYSESTHPQASSPVELGYNFLLEPSAGNHSIKLRAYVNNNLTYEILETNYKYFTKLDPYLKLNNTNITLEETNSTLRINVNTNIETYPSRLEYASIDLLLNDKIIWSECWSKTNTNSQVDVPTEAQLTYEFQKPGGTYKLTAQIYARNTAKTGNSTSIMIKQKEPDPTSELQNYVLQLVNEYRKQNNRPPLDISESYIAQEYAKEMLLSNDFKHNPDLPVDVSENIAMIRYYDYYYTEEEAIARMIYLMMYEDEAHNWGHRYNILNYYYETVSIGVAYDEKYIYLVQNFFKP